MSKGFTAEPSQILSGDEARALGLKVPDDCKTVLIVPLPDGIPNIWAEKSPDDATIEDFREFQKRKHGGSE